MKRTFLALAIALCCWRLHVSSPAEAAVYVVSADIVATTETPGFAYSRERGFIEYQKGLKEALVYGNMVNVAPLETGEYAGREGEAFDAEGRSLGYVSMSALTSVPAYQTFPPEPFRFAVDSPDLFILPGALPVLDYTLPDAEPYYVLAGEVTDGVGTYTDEGGTDWTLLSFETSRYSGVGFRYAWIRSKDVMRLSARTPDFTKVDPTMIPRFIRDFGPLENRFYDRIAQSGFAIDAAPVFHETLTLDDLVESYPNSMFDSVYVPNFVTTDVFLHAFHLLFTRSLKNMEEINFAPGMNQMLRDALTNLDDLENRALEQSGGAHNPENVFLLKAFTRARDFLTVPAALLSPNEALRSSSRALEEISRIMRGEDTEISAISGIKEDYTFYKPRGHYTTSETLSRYFRAAAYLGGVNIPLGGETPEEELANTALIGILCALFGEGDLNRQWKALYEPLTYLIGETDDLSVAHAAPVAAKIKDRPALIGDVKAVEALRKELLAAAPAPRIIDRPSSVPSMSEEETENESLGFRLLGRRFVPDAWVFTRLTSPRVGSDAIPRNLPKTEDVMAALGSEAAEAALSADKREIPKYAGALEKTKADLYEFFRKGSPSLYTDWLGANALLFADRDSKQFFAGTPLWDRKRLLTASASWAELKHDTLLYAKQNYAEMGDGGEWAVEPFRNPVPRGYVEPAPQVFNALFNALDRLREIIARYNLGEREEEQSWNGVRSKIEAFREHVLLFRDIAEKEVRDEPLSADDYWAISLLTSYLNANLLLDSNTTETDAESQEMLKMALVSDVATDALAGRVLHAATGAPRRMYVFVDDAQSGPRVTVGYTYSFYSFIRSLDEGRMTDEEWKSLVYDPDRQEELEKLAPEWSEELFVK